MAATDIIKRYYKMITIFLTDIARLKKAETNININPSNKK